MLASADDGKIALVINLDKSVTEIDAVALIRELGPIIGGGGGGRPTLAEAGGKNPENLRDALALGTRPARRSYRRVKVLALDFGSARTGVAVSDPTGTVARPLTTVERAATDAGFARLLAVIAEEEPVLVVVGLPLTLARRTRRAGARDRGVRRAAARRVHDAGRAYDERFTSVLAGGDDARAAAHLLSSYLEWQTHRP